MSDAVTLLGREPLGSTSPRRSAEAAGGRVTSQDTWPNNEPVITPNTTTRLVSRSELFCFLEYSHLPVVSLEGQASS